MKTTILIIAVIFLPVPLIRTGIIIYILFKAFIEYIDALGFEFEKMLRNEI